MNLSHVSRIVRVTVMVIALLGMGSRSSAETTYGPWEIYTGITGVGDVSKTSPAEDHLHYNGNSNPELASFAVDVYNAYDYDRRYVCVDGEFDHWDVQDAGLNVNETDWQCTAGSILDGTFTTTYTPPNTPTSGIVVKVDVFDDIDYNSNDAKVTKQYANTLKAYKVGVHLSTSPGGGNYTKWEDATTEGTKPVEVLDTYITCSQTDADIDNDTCDGTWTLITSPSGCDIHGQIRGSSSSSASGEHLLGALESSVGDSAAGSCSVGVSVLIFSFSYSWNLSEQGVTYAINSSSIGYGSDYGTEYEETGLTLVYEGDSTAQRTIDADPGTGEWTGKEGADKDGKWKVETKAKTKIYGYSTASAIGGTDADCTFDIPNTPSYEGGAQ